VTPQQIESLVSTERAEAAFPKPYRNGMVPCLRFVPASEPFSPGGGGGGGGGVGGARDGRVKCSDSLARVGRHLSSATRIRPWRDAAVEELRRLTRSKLVMGCEREGRSRM